jgi:hypothetical protein
MFHQLFNEDGEGFIELLKGENLNQNMLKFAPLCSPHIHTFIASFKHDFKNMGSINYIFMLNALSPYKYV